MSDCVHHYTMIQGGMRCQKCGDIFGAKTGRDPFDVAVEALEQAGFRGEWRYDDPEETALGAAVAAATIAVEALREEGLLS